jgi:hypothetical protein
MPYQAPGSLDEGVYWQLTAYLLWKNGLIDLNEYLDSANATKIYIKQPALVIAPSVLSEFTGIQETRIASGINFPNHEPTMPKRNTDSLLFIFIGLVLAVAAIVWVLIRYRGLFQ